MSREKKESHTIPSEVHVSAEMQEETHTLVRELQVALRSQLKELKLKQEQQAQLNQFSGWQLRVSARDPLDV